MEGNCRIGRLRARQCELPPNTHRDTPSTQSEPPTHLRVLQQHVPVPRQRVRARVAAAADRAAHLVVHVRQPLQQRLDFGGLGLGQLRGVVQGWGGGGEFRVGGRDCAVFRRCCCCWRRSATQCTPFQKTQPSPHAPPTGELSTPAAHLVRPEPAAPLVAAAVRRLIAAGELGEGLQLHLQLALEPPRL
jgi:hypothetical protein